VDTYASALRTGPEVAHGFLAFTLASILLNKRSAAAKGQNLPAIDALLQQDIGRGVGISVRLGLGDGGRKGAGRQDRENGEKFHGDLWGRGVFFLKLRRSRRTECSIFELIWKVLSVMKKTRYLY
jgi:hypothetical protein